jgi:hypothetical protein
MHDRWKASEVDHTHFTKLASVNLRDNSIATSGYPTPICFYILHLEEITTKFTNLATFTLLILLARQRYKLLVIPLQV